MKKLLGMVAFLILSMSTYNAYALSMSDVIANSSPYLSSSNAYCSLEIMSRNGRATAYVEKIAYYQNDDDKFYNVYIQYADRSDVYLSKYKIVNNKKVKLISQSRVTVDTLQTISTNDYSAVFNGLYNENGIEVSPKKDVIAQLLIQVAEQEDNIEQSRSNVNSSHKNLFSTNEWYMS